MYIYIYIYIYSFYIHIHFGLRVGLHLAALTPQGFMARLVGTATGRVDNRSRLSWLNPENDWIELRGLMHGATSDRLGRMLWNAASFGCVGATTHLLEARASPNYTCQSSGRDALHETCVWGWGDSLSVVRLLLRYDADVNSLANLNGKSMTAIHMAARKQRADIVAAISGCELGLASPGFQSPLQGITPPDTANTCPRRRSRRKMRTSTGCHVGAYRLRSRSPRMPASEAGTRSPASRPRALFLCRDDGSSHYSSDESASNNEGDEVVAGANASTCVDPVKEESERDHKAHIDISNVTVVLPYLVHEFYF